MKLYVCVKHVPDTEARIEPVGGSKINEGDIKWMLSPYDEYAVEEAIQLKEKGGDTEVIAVSMGSEKAIETVRKALAMGADRAVHIVTDQEYDHNITATALAKAIKDEGDASVIFMGKQAIDDDSYQVHVRVAYQLEASVATNVTAFALEGDAVQVEREIDEGAKEKIEMKIPAVVAVTKGINSPRYPSLPNIMKAKKKEVKTVTLADLGITDTANCEEIVELSLPPEKAGGQVVDGEFEVSVPKLAVLLKDEAKLF